MTNTATITRALVSHRFGARYVYDSDFAIDTVRFDGSPVRVFVGGNTSLKNLQRVLRGYGVTTFVLAWESK